MTIYSLDILLFLFATSKMEYLSQIGSEGGAGDEWNTVCALWDPGVSESIVFLHDRCSQKSYIQESPCPFWKSWSCKCSWEPPKANGKMKRPPIPSLPSTCAAHSTTTAVINGLEHSPSLPLELLPTSQGELRSQFNLIDYHLQSCGYSSERPS